MLCLIHLLSCHLLFILHQQIYRYLHLIEFVLVSDHARRLVLLLQLKMSLVLINMHLQHFYDQLEWITDVARELRRAIKRANMKLYLLSDSALLLRDLALHESPIKIMRHLYALVQGCCLSPLLFGLLL